MNEQKKLQTVLLVHPDAMTRRTAASTASAMGVAEVIEFEDVAAAQAALHTSAFDAAVLASGDMQGVARLVETLRRGTSRSAADVSVLFICKPEVTREAERLNNVRTVAAPLSVRTMLLEMHALLAPRSSNRPAFAPRPAAAAT